MIYSKLLDFIPESTWNKLTKELNVDFKSKKIDGRTLFSLLIYSFLNTKQTSLRVMETLFNSYVFQKANPSLKNKTIRFTSIGQRLSTINSDFYRKLFEECTKKYSKKYKHNDKLIRFDSTMVSLSAKLINIGFICGGGHDNSRQIKFTIGFSEIPEYVDFYHTPTYNSENVALKESILNCNVGKDKIVLFDRGIQARGTFDLFENDNIQFITRINPKPRKIQVSENIISSPIEEGQLIIYEDIWVNLIDRNKKQTKHPFRYILAKNKTNNTEIAFLTNIKDLSTQEITTMYKRRWDIEVFFKFLKQELNFSHLISRNENGIKVILYTTLILSILLTIYKTENNLKGYKIPKLKLACEIEEYLLLSLMNLNNQIKNNSS